MAFRLNQHPAEVLRRVEQLLADDAQRHAAPVVVWSAPDESATSFAVRIAHLRQSHSGRILAAVVAGFRVPQGVQPVEFIEKAHTALHPSNHARNIILRGGRGGTKSWAVARALVLRALVEPIRVLCLREIQRSLKDSSLRLLSDQIEALKLDRFFSVLANSITSSAGASFLFEGLYSNEQRIKSLEGVDVAWIEQGEQISEASWTVLLPTIRKVGSQVIATTNPDLSDDPIHVRFHVNQPPNTVSAEMSYLNNPWCSPEMHAEADYLKRVDSDAYEHIWHGQLRQHSDAQVLKGKYEIGDFEVDSSWAGPFLGADWGFSVDPTCLIRSFIDETTNTLFVSDEAYQVECPLDRLPLLFGTVAGSRDSVIYADNARPEVINHLKSHGYGYIRSCDKWDGSVQDGVLTLRSFAKIVISQRCPHVATEAKLWSYRVDRSTGAVLPDLKPGNEHCFDAIRYSLQERIRRAPGQGIRDYYQQKHAAAAAPSPDIPHAAPRETMMQRTSRPGVNWWPM